MPLFQPTLHAPPDEPTVEGQTIIVTGSNSGIGLETARQLLLRGAATLILAVRNIHKGELAKASLLSDPAVRQRKYTTAPHVAVMELDMADYGSVTHFAAAATATLPALHLLLLNAGCGGSHSSSGTTITTDSNTERTSSDSNGSGDGASSSSSLSDRRRQRQRQHRRHDSKHERTLQVNYLSNVLLLLSLLPLLRASAALAGRPSRVTWTGSRAHALTARTTVARLAASFLSSSPSSSPPSSSASGIDDTLLGGLDAAAAKERWHFSPLARYADSKLLAALFLYELRRRLGVRAPQWPDGDGGGGGDAGGEVVINMFCPGMVDTRIGDALPWYLRWPLGAAMALGARGVEQAGWVAVNAAVVAGAESHGRFLGDMEVFGETEFIRSEEGKRVRAMLWEETVAEMSKLVEVPEWMKGARPGGVDEGDGGEKLAMQADMSDR